MVKRRKIVQFNITGKILVLIFLMFSALVCGVLLYITTNLPDVDKIATYVPDESTILYSIHGKEIARLHGEENRQLVPLSQISPYLVECVLTTEDAKFFEHHGVDFLGIGRAVLKNLSRGRLAQGASTITQQLARSLFLTRKRTFARKIAEAILAFEIERKYTKEEILELYLNNVYWGHNAYGIESASRLYFGKPAKDLDLAESALLTGLLEGPELYSPYKNIARAKAKQAYVLSRLVDTNRISQATADEAYNQELTFPRTRLARFGHIAPYFVSYVLSYLTEKYGEEKVYGGGLKVYTTLDLELQDAADEIVTKYVSEEGGKYNFTQAALVAIDPRTGYIKAMVGGTDFGDSKFNRVTQSKRQPGSSFKPFVYTAAMEKGYSPGTIIMDRIATWEVPTTEWNPKGKWIPQNFNRKTSGPVTLRHALEMSLNIPAIKLLEKVGISSVIDVARRMGIRSHLDRNLALALGVSDVTLKEMTSAYGVLANSGIRVEPAGIIKVVDRRGKTLERHQIEGKRVLKPNIAAAMVDLMKGVLLRGTGVRGRLNREAAAKTGTTEDYKDAWFIGFVPQLVCGVWVGNDDNTVMKGIAEVAVCPRMWKSFMKVALKDIPTKKFPRPKGQVSVKICIDSGQLATNMCPANRVRYEKFWKNRVPNENCQVHLGIIEEAGDHEEIFINEPPPEGYLIR
ncbi:MAG: penicillin-binding protein 1A [Candidatus Margulisbacteria bacterium]|nr:penicillin-binding protein 1A [Candidatus Margulisiibacteriota bacterium]MBU1022591.1 penicillin-binding protein 1A [Candidatus Margulisiibacteriota bacterium]MBU1728877.1 penicillin-binding protein 1A [Candidatus Margulisiibacteriota bacterium]MBU1955508.1 penicillin-binding protein 1A [Candidatus Margulisiibacteriota bacterium]